MVYVAGGVTTLSTLAMATQSARGFAFSAAPTVIARNSLIRRRAGSSTGCSSGGSVGRRLPYSTRAAQRICSENGGATGIVEGVSGESGVAEAPRARLRQLGRGNEVCVHEIVSALRNDGV